MFLLKPCLLCFLLFIRFGNERLSSSAVSESSGVFVLPGVLLLSGLVLFMQDNLT